MRKFLFYVILFCLIVLAINYVNATMPHKGSAVSKPVVAHAVRLNQLDCQQYASQTACETWSPSTCSAAVMAEGMNVFGHSYSVGDVLAVEAAFRNPTVITPDDGLLYPGGIDRTVHAFGFQTTWLKNPTVDQLEAATAKAPVIVNFPPPRWPGGHFLIVSGGDATHVDLVDSSSLNMQSMSMAKFLYYWLGFAVQVTPQQGGQQ